MRFLLNGNDWEAGFFISTEADNQQTMSPHTIENMSLQGAVAANFIGLPGLGELCQADYKATVPGCDRSVLMENGEIGVVVIGEEATLKRVYYDRPGQKLILTPENPRYAPLVFTGEELDTVKILGRAVAFQSLVR